MALIVGIVMERNLKTVERKRRRFHAQAQKRYRDRRNLSTSPEDGLAAVVKVLTQRGETRQGVLGKLTALKKQALTASLLHGLDIDVLTLSERYNHPKGGGAKGRFWSLKD